MSSDDPFPCLGCQFELWSHRYINANDEEKAFMWLQLVNHINSMDKVYTVVKELKANSAQR